MSVIVMLAYQRPAPRLTWTQFGFGDRIVPALVARRLLPRFRRWADHVRPIFSSGDLVGLWASNLMTSRKWKRLRDAAEPLLVHRATAQEATTSNAPPAADALILSLTSHGLWIPQRRVERARTKLSECGDVEIECEREWGNGVELLIARGASLARVLLALELEVEPIEEETSSAVKKALLQQLRAEFIRLDPSLARAASQ
jgi:hypothetical protein